MQLLNAQFTTQDAAESAVRKLASLRSDGIRLERKASNPYGNTPLVDADQSVEGLTATVLAGNPIQAYSGVMGTANVSVNEWGVFRDADSVADRVPNGAAGQNASASEFSLSVNVPSGVADQARKVILEAGGQMS